MENLRKNLFDFTEISLLPRFKFNRGTSPFAFDQVVDNKAIELRVKQQLYGPVILNFTGELSLDKKDSNDDGLINPVVDIGWNRRAYSVNLFYNLDTEVGGINFKINTFDFQGLGKDLINTTKKISQCFVRVSSWGHSSAGRAPAWHAGGQGSSPLGSI